MVLGARCHQVALKKLEIVSEELVSRNISLHVPRKRDVAIPITVCLLTFGISTTVSSFLLDVTSTSVAVSTGPDVNVTQALHDPADFASQMMQGAQFQVEQVLAGPTDVGHAGVAAMDSQIAHANAAGMNTSAFATGMQAMQGVEILALEEATKPLAYKFRGTIQGQTSQTCSVATMSDCTHKTVTPECIKCAKIMDKAIESYYHCCVCWREGYPFDACEPCVMKLDVGCLERDEHVLHRVAASAQDDAVKEKDQRGSVFVSSTPVGVF
jgi:hypothetical protein